MIPIESTQTSITLRKGLDSGGKSRTREHYIIWQCINEFLAAKASGLQHPSKEAMVRDEII